MWCAIRPLPAPMFAITVSILSKSSYHDAKHAAATPVQRALAFKWMRVIWKCWQTRTPYNEVVYLESLRKKGSSLLKFAADHQA